MICRLEVRKWIGDYCGKGAEVNMQDLAQRK